MYFVVGTECHPECTPRTPTWPPPHRSALPCTLSSLTYRQSPPHRTNTHTHTHFAASLVTIRWAATASYDAGTVSVVELLSAPGPAVEVSQQQLQPAATDPAVAAAQGEDGPSAASAEAQAVFLPAELRLGQHTTYPTEVVGKAAHEAKFSPDGTLLYVPCLKSDHIRMFNFNADTGSLTPNDYPAAEGAAAATATDAPAGSTSTFDDINPALLSPAEAMHGSSSGSSKIAPAAAAAAASERNMARLPAGSGPRHVVFHPSLPVAYVLNELDSTIARFDWDTSSGGRLVADFSRDAGRIVSILPPGASAEPVCIRYGVPGVQAGANPPGSITCEEYCSPQAGGELAISNDGRFLYASNRGLCEESDRPGVSNVVVFGVEGSTGALTPLAWEDADGEVNFPRHFSLTPDEGNAFLLVANQTGESVTVLRRDAGSGMLSKVGTVSTAAAGVQQPSFVAVM